MKCIGVLTSGGDTPGMNAAIRAVFKEGENRGINVMGIYHGYKGLIAGMVRQLTHEDVANVMHKGGTVLRRSSRTRSRISLAPVRQAPVTPKVMPS